MEQISVGIFGNHLRLHYGYFSAFYQIGSDGFDSALKIIEKRNPENLDIYEEFHTLLFEEDDFGEGKLGFNLQEDINCTVYPMSILSENQLDDEETRDRLIAQIDKELKAVEEEDQGVLELTKELVLPEPTEEELVRKEVEELIKEVELQRNEAQELASVSADIIPMKKTEFKIHRWLRNLKSAAI